MQIHFNSVTYTVFGNQFSYIYFIPLFFPVYKPLWIWKGLGMSIAMGTGIAMMAWFMGTWMDAVAVADVDDLRLWRHHFRDIFSDGTENDNDEWNDKRFQMSTLSFPIS